MGFPARSASNNTESVVAWGMVMGIAAIGRSASTQSSINEVVKDKVRHRKQHVKID